MICKHCGAEIDDKAALCLHCGKMVKRKKKIPTGIMILIIAIIIFYIVAGVIGLVYGPKIEKANYEAIIATVEDGEYEKAKALIEDFIKDYPDSEYLSEIDEKKEKVDAEILKKENAKKANVSLKEFENMLAACENIGINKGEISNITAKDNWANGKRCAFNYSGYEFLAYFNQDETVNSINCGTVKFYENGKKVEDLKNRLITADERIQLKSWSEETIKKILKSPSTAKFAGGFLTPYEDWSFSKNGTTYTVSSYVDSQNGFGAMLRKQFTITYEWNDETSKVTSLIFDGKKSHLIKSEKYETKLNI